MSAGRAWSRAGLVAALVLLVDQLSKALVRHDVTVGDENSVFFLLKIAHVRNKGVAFSAFENQAGLVIAVIVIAVIALLYYFATHTEKAWIWLPTGLLAGGAVGNILDRVLDGAVTDFLKVPHWPAFNVADIAITVGVLALVLVLENGAADDA